MVYCLYTHTIIQVTFVFINTSQKLGHFLNNGQVYGVLCVYSTCVSIFTSLNHTGRGARPAGVPTKRGKIVYFYICILYFTMQYLCIYRVR